MHFSISFFHGCAKCYEAPADGRSQWWIIHNEHVVQAKRIGWVHVVFWPVRAQQLNVLRVWVETAGAKSTGKCLFKGVPMKLVEIFQNLLSDLGRRQTEGFVLFLI